MAFNNLRIIFMGTPEFAVSSLEALLQHGANIVAVVTAPDKAAGRGMKVTQSAVKQFAIANGLKVLQPTQLKEASFLEELRMLNADLQVIVAFRMLPEIVWSMPRLGSINLHASLLPEYRGAAPINWAIINGEKETGVTTFQLKHEIDTGHILLQQKIDILPNDTAGIIHDKMKTIGANLLVETIKKLNNNELKAIPQDAQNHKHAPKIFTQDCQLDFSKTTTQLHNLVRGLSPYPSAFTKIQGKILKIYASTTEICPHTEKVGSWHTDQKTYAKIACQDGFLHLLEMQLEGKKKMTIVDFLRGNAHIFNQPNSIK